MKGNRFTISILSMQLALGPQAVVWAKEAQAKQDRLLIVADAETAIAAQQIQSDLLGGGYPSTILRRLPASDPSESSRQSLKEAKKFVRALKFDQALKKLSRARDAADLATLREVFLQEAFIFHTLQDRSGATDILESFILVGGSSPDETYYPPEFISLYQKAKTRVLKRPMVFLRVQLAEKIPVAEQLSIDGSSVNRQRQQQVRVHTGQHFVEALVKGYFPYRATLQVESSGRAVEISPKPISLEAFAAEVRLAADRGPQIQFLQDKSNATSVLWVESGSLSLWANGSVRWTKAFDSTDLRIASNELQQRLTGRSAPVAKAPAPVPSPVPVLAFVPAQDSFFISEPAHKPEPVLAKKGSPAWYQKWWFWTIVGTAAASGGAGAFLMTRGSGGIPSTIQLSVTPK